MRKFVYYLGTFFVGILFLQFVLYLGLKLLLDSHSQFRLSRFFRQPNHAFVAMGNSRTVNAVNEHFARTVLHRDLINIGFSGMPYANLLDLFKEVNRTNKGTTILLEITSVVNDEADHSYVYYMANSKYIASRYKNDPAAYLHLLRLNNEFFVRNFYYLDHSDDEWLYSSHINPKKLNLEVQNDKPSRLFPKFSVFKLRMDSLQSFCDSCHNHIIFFLAPFYPQSLKKYLDYKDILNFMYFSKSKFKFVNLNSEPLTEDMFADRVHTNITGSYLLTKALLAFAEK